MKERRPYRSYAEVIGDPISHSKSPLIHGFWLGKLGIEADYRAFHVKPTELAEYFLERRADPHWLGCNVTIPHKIHALELIGRGDARSIAVGAANTVFRENDELAATNTDVDGILEAISAATYQGLHAVVIGSGGAARAAFQALSTLNCASVSVISRLPQRAADIANEFDITSAAISLEMPEAALDGASLLINASPMGMSGQQAMPGKLLGSLSLMEKTALVFDMVYAPLQTDLLKQAKQDDHQTADGLQMLIGQAASAFQIFFGAAAPRQYDEELRKLLTS